MSKSQKILIIFITTIVLIYFAYKAKANYMSEETNEKEVPGNNNFHVESFNGIPGSKNFSLSEFHCKDGTPVPKSLYSNLQTLINNLQIIRDHIGLPITINSGYRTESHNRNEGGAPNSMHLQAAAADIVVIGMGASEVRKKIQLLIDAGKLRNGGIGSYPNFTHYDIGTVRRWTK